MKNTTLQKFVRFILKLQEINKPSPEEDGLFYLGRRQGISPIRPLVHRLISVRSKPIQFSVVRYTFENV